MKWFRWIGVLIAAGLVASSIGLWNNAHAAAPVQAAVATTLPVIVVDAGHGGIDGGASGADGTVEKEINLAIAKNLAAMLDVFGFPVVMTRETDDLISDPSLPTIRQRKRQDILKRLEISESYSDGLLVSIHQNYFESSRYSGAQVFYSKANPQSADLARIIRQSILSRLQPENTREIKPVGSEIYLLYHSTRPAVMVECGFMSNQKELSQLKNAAYQRSMAFCIAAAVVEFCNNTP